MGAYMFSYAVNYEELKSACGSKDESLYEEIRKHPKFQFYDNQNESPGFSMKDALRQIIDGHPSFGREVAVVYWYTIIAMVDYFGERLRGSHEIKLYYETDLIDKYLIEDFDVEFRSLWELLNENFSLMGQRLRSNEGIFSGLLKWVDLYDMQKKLSRVSITKEQIEKLLIENAEKEMAYDAIKQIQDNVNYCIANNVSMVVFAH